MAPSRPLGAPRARPDCAARGAPTVSQRVRLALLVSVLPAVRAALTTRTAAAVMWAVSPARSPTVTSMPTRHTGLWNPAQPVLQAGRSRRRPGKGVPDASAGRAHGIEARRRQGNRAKCLR